MTPAAPEVQGATLVVHLEGYDGPIDLLLDLARAQKVDLARLSLRALIDQYLAAVEAQREGTTLTARSDWLIAASRLVLLKSRLLVQGDDAAAPAEAERLLEALALAAQRQHARALAQWLAARPQLGQAVFARGQAPPPQSEGRGDLLDLLLACFDLLEPPAPPEPPPRYAPPVFDVCSLTEALLHLEARLQAQPAGVPLALFRPDASAEESSCLRRRSTVASSFLAGLELARQGRVVLQQEHHFGPLHCCPSGPI